MLAEPTDRYAHGVLGDDFEADMAKMAADPETQRWWTIMEPMQMPLNDLSFLFSPIVGGLRQHGAHDARCPASPGVDQCRRQLAPVLYRPELQVVGAQQGGQDDKKQEQAIPGMQFRLIFLSSYLLVFRAKALTSLLMRPVRFQSMT